GALAPGALSGGNPDHLVEQAGRDAAVHRLGKAAMGLARSEAQDHFAAFPLGPDVEPTRVVGAAHEAAARAKQRFAHWFDLSQAAKSCERRRHGLRCPSMPRWALVLLLASAPSWAAPLPESAAGRRAVRGGAVDVTRESDELRQLREFDEESFPRPLPGLPPTTVIEDDAATVRRTSATGGAGPSTGPPPLPSPPP